ncbi:bactofilin family protein [Caloranaerobacter ferrireducens]|uniref:bactofilin family protein n=1 Tax=Caloranaerobacter ferrireducens TaxID=1323370 RepID=UPI00084DE85A|nr:polymer-forming cytoskeletal protein [Caloranaerobacter ferrireducens]
MFNKKEVKLDKIDTLIGKNTKLEGKIECKGTIRLDGELTGDLIVEGNVIIGESGKVNGNITCNNVFISGIVKGNVISKEMLRLTNTAKLYGDIQVKTFIVDENAVFEGSCKMEATKTSNETKVNKESKKSK